MIRLLIKDYEFMSRKRNCQSQIRLVKINSNLFNIVLNLSGVLFVSWNNIATHLRCEESFICHFTSSIFQKNSFIHWAQLINGIKIIRKKNKIPHREYESTNLTVSRSSLIIYLYKNWWPTWAKLKK